LPQQAASARRWFYGLAAIAYYLAATLLHDRVSKLYEQVFLHFGRESMEFFLHGASLVLAGIVLAAAWRFLAGRGSRIGVAAVLWAVGLGLALVADTVLIVTNVERIHYPQYAILALLMIPVLPSYFTVLVACAAAGAVDEFLQFAILPHYTQYLDFNDFFLNLTGAGLGLALHASFGKASPMELSRPKPVDAKAVALTLLLIIGLLGAGAAGRIVHQAPVREGYPLIQQVEGNKALVLSFRTKDGFWTTAAHGRTYHILSPLGGAATVVGALGFYAAVLTIVSRRRGSAANSGWLSD